MLAANLEEMGKDSPVYERRRQCNSSTGLVMCNGCKMFLQSANLSTHKVTCCVRKRAYPIDISLFKNTSLELSEEFKKNVLGTLRGDSIGMKCRQDQAILLFGFRLYDKVKKRDDNIMGCRKDVRTKMRVLAHLNTYFLEKYEKTNLSYNNIKDMFNTDNFEILKEAIEGYTTKENNSIKSALKTNLQFILVKAANIFKATAITDKNDPEANMFERFQCVLKLWQVSFNKIKLFNII